MYPRLGKPCMAEPYHCPHRPYWNTTDKKIQKEIISILHLIVSITKCLIMIGCYQPFINGLIGCFRSTLSELTCPITNIIL